MDLLIAGLPVSGMIVAFVEGAKRLGLPARWAPLVAVLLGLVCGVLAYLGTILPSVHQWYEAAGGGVILGLSAAGLYSGAKATASPKGDAGMDSA
jgi:hypothetical protein